jgi:hypothetical protein
MTKDLAQADRTTMFSGCDQWGDRFGKIKWVDFFQIEIAILEGAEKPNIIAAAGAKGFNRKRTLASLAEVC